MDHKSRSGGNRACNASRSAGMGGSGTAITINSHILMSLSRSATSKSSSEQEDSDQDKEDPANRVNQAFKNERDNICNLAVNF